MDERLTRLNRIRGRKAEAAQLNFLRARRHFSHAAHIVETLGQKRAQAERAGNEALAGDLAGLIGAVADMSAVAALHEGAERRRLGLQAMDGEIARATAEREKLRQAALEQQQRFQEARKQAKKLDLLTDTLRTNEKSLQTRLMESRSDSALKDHTTGRWKLLHPDQ